MYTFAQPLSRALSTAGWYLTGDLGYRDEECYIYLAGRARDMIVSGGENIYSTEVEDAHWAGQQAHVSGG